MDGESLPVNPDYIKHETKLELKGNFLMLQRLIQSSLDAKAGLRFNHQR